MKIQRRRFLRLAVGAVTVPAMMRTAFALDYPTRSVRVVVGFPAGIGPDIVGRIMGQWLSDRLGQQFIVENRTGASSNIGTEFVAKAPPDGYMLLVATSTNAVNASTYKHLNFNFVRDLTPVGFIGSVPFVMVVPSSFPAKTVPEFIAYAKASPGKINMASQGNGTSPHVAGELFKIMSGVDLTHVPYRGNSIPDLLAGQVQVYFSPMSQVIQYIRDGQLHALAVTTAVAAEALPNVPTLREYVPGYTASGWYGVCAPTGTPANIIDKLNKELSAGSADPSVRARLIPLGVDPKAMTPAEFGTFIAEETDKWAKVVAFANITAD
jgi:tripartite-type tricarboxylate transporter receptor subunit TctC